METRNNSDFEACPLYGSTMDRGKLFEVLGPGVLCGMTFGDWFGFARNHYNKISPACFPRVLSITVQSIQNSGWRMLEKRHESQLAHTEIKPPVFILGHWRSGTTHLHELLSQDSQFGFPTTYQASFPKIFLASEAKSAPMLDRIIPRRRPMDNMELAMGSPQEDEFALCSLTQFSPWMAWVFPQHKENYLKYLTLRNIPKHELESWQASLVWFLKKVQLKDPRPLLLKSPPHTARIRTLLHLFPGAKFIHIHRHPFDVFKSSRHLFSTIMKWHRLQIDNTNDLDTFVLRQYNEMFDAFFEDWPAIPPEQCVEISFSDLEREPMAQLEKIYSALSLSGFEDSKTNFTAFLEKRSAYKKNNHHPLASEEKSKVADHWKRSFQKWNYSI